MTEPDENHLDQRSAAQFTHDIMMSNLFSQRPPLIIQNYTQGGSIDQLHHSLIRPPPRFTPHEQFDQRPLFSPQALSGSVPFIQREEDTAAQFIPGPDNNSPGFVAQNNTGSFLPQVHKSHQPPAYEQHEPSPITFQVEMNKPTESNATAKTSQENTLDVNPDNYNVERITENPASPPPEEVTKAPTIESDENQNDSETDITQPTLTEANENDNNESSTAPFISKRRLVSNLRPHIQTDAEKDSSTKKVYTEDDKLAIIHQAKIYGIDKAAEKYNVPKNSIIMWKKAVSGGRPLRGRGRPKGTAPRKVIMDRAVQVTFHGERTLADIMAAGEDITGEPNVADSVEAFPSDCAIKVRRHRARRKRKPMTYNTDDYFDEQMEEQGNILADFAEIVASESFMTDDGNDDNIEVDDDDDDDADEDYPTKRRSRLRRRFTAVEKKNILEFAQLNSLRSTSKKFRVPITKILRWKEISKNDGELVGDNGEDEFVGETRSRTRRSGPKKRRGNLPNVPRGPYKKYSLEFKTTVVDYTRKHSLRKAADHFKMPVSTVMAWKRELEKPNVARNENTGRKIGSGRVISYSPQVDTEIVNWITAKKDAKIHIGIRDICQFAQTLVCNENPDSTFKASHGWVTKFIKRHKIHLDRCRKRRPHPQGECGKANGAQGGPKKPRSIKRDQPVLPPTLPIPDMRRDIQIPHDRGQSVERHQTTPTIQYSQYSEIHSQVPVFTHNYMYGLSPLPPPTATHAAHIPAPTESLHSHTQTANLQYNTWMPSTQSNALTYSAHSMPNAQPHPQTYWTDFPRADYNPQQQQQ